MDTTQPIRNLLQAIADCDVRVAAIYARTLHDLFRTKQYYPTRNDLQTVCREFAGRRPSEPG